MPDASLGRLLIVDDEAPQLAALSDTLEQQGYSIAGVSSAEEALAVLRPECFDLLLTDLKLPGMDGVALLRQALSMDPNLVGILMTGHGTIATAVQAMQVGALDYILKPFKLSAVLPVLARALAVRRLRMENADLEQRVRQRSAELEAANKELDAFAFSISHDLRVPLRAVTGYASILMDDHGADMTPGARELVGLISRAGKQGEQLVEDLLRFSRVGRHPLSNELINLTPLVREIVDELRRHHPSRRVLVKVDDLPEVVGDRALLWQVFVNLLSNAVKFTRDRDPANIEVGSQVLDGERVFFVRDNGIGFDMRLANRLFGVFQRLHRHDEFDGTGVGLSLVQRIVHRHGGRIWAESTVDHGATFYFTLQSGIARES